DGVGEQTRRGGIMFLYLADTDQPQALRRVPGLELALQESRQLGLEGDQLLGLANPLGRGEGPAGLLRPKLVAPAQQLQALGEVALVTQDLPEETVCLGSLRPESDDFAVGSSPLVGFPLGLQE